MLRINPAHNVLLHGGNLTYEMVNYQATNEVYGKNKLIGDYTAKYTYMFRTQTIERIYHFTPNAKLIYILRDPTERARSHLNYVLNFGPKYFQPPSEKIITTQAKEQIHWLYVETIEKYKNCLTMYCEEYCATNMPDGPDFFATSMKNLIEKSLLNGLYHVFLRKQLNVVPQENVLIIDLGEFSESPFWFMQNTVLPFIGLGNYSVERRRQYLRVRAHANKNRGSILRLLPETTELLRQFYNESLIKLSALLHGRTFTWYPIYGL